MATQYQPHISPRGTLSPALSRLAAAVETCIDDIGVRKVADLIGKPKSCVHRWRRNLGSLSLLALMQRSTAVEEAVARLATGEVSPDAEPTAAIPGACETVRQAAELTAQLVAAIQDGQFDKPEARQVITKIRVFSLLLTKLERDVRAAAL